MIVNMNMISIPFEINGYRDALHLREDHTFTEMEIEAMKQARYDKWYAHINGLAYVDPNSTTVGE